MATNRNIQMNYYNGTDYDVLYPETTAEQAKSLSINGGTVNGDIILSNETSNNMGVVTKEYVDNSIKNITSFPVMKETSIQTSGTPSILIPALMWDGTIKDVTLTINYKSWQNSVSAVYVYSFYNIIALKVLNNTGKEVYLTPYFNLTVPSGYKMKDCSGWSELGIYAKKDVELSGNTYNIEFDDILSFSSTSVTIFIGTNVFAVGNYQEPPYPYSALYIPASL